jgi:hypothetical protein
MVKADHVFRTRSCASDGETQWHDCVDYILENKSQRRHL